MTKIIEKIWEYIDRDDFELAYQKIGHGIRGVYALYQKDGNKFNVVYIGMSDTGMLGGRFKRDHLKSKSKEWTYFSIFKVFDDVSKSQIRELEAMFTEIFRKDAYGLKYNKQKKHSGFDKVKWERFKKDFLRASQS